jgi:pyrimidine operon attenuation protein / uracil phosphoribosyltransferase
MSDRSLILNADDIKKKITRIAYEIAERNYDETELLLLGIEKNGVKIATQLAETLTGILNAKVQVGDIKINKKNPVQEDVVINYDHNNITGKVVIIVDDVANTGRTLLYAMKPLLTFLPKKIQIAVIVDRQHKSFPVCPDYIGISLSTNMQEHVDIQLAAKAGGVYLS